MSTKGNPEGVFSVTHYFPKKKKTETEGSPAAATTTQKVEKRKKLKTLLKQKIYHIQIRLRNLFKLCIYFVDLLPAFLTLWHTSQVI